MKASKHVLITTRGSRGFSVPTFTFNYTQLYEQITTQLGASQPIPTGIAIACGNELIAAIQGGSPDLTLTGNYFQFS